MNKTDKLKEFKKEINKPINVDLKVKFYELIKRDNVEILSNGDLRALFYRALLLNDQEREKFIKYLVLENMTKEEEKRYRYILPNHIFERYFPSKEAIND